MKYIGIVVLMAVLLIILAGLIYGYSQVDKKEKEIKDKEHNKKK